MDSLDGRKSRSCGSKSDITGSVHETRRDCSRRKALIACSCRPSSAAEAAPSGLRLVLVAFLAFGFELRVLLLGQDSFCLLHVFSFARFGATGFLMLGHNGVHLRFLIGRQVEVGQ